MPDSVKTHYVKGGFATSDDIVLSVTPLTRVIFRPGMHKKGVRGELIRQKKGKDGTWKTVNEVNFSQVPPDCGVAIDLGTEATKKLFEKLATLYQVQEQGVQYGDQDFVVAKKDEVLLVDDAAKAKAIKELLDQGYSEKFWQALTENEPDLASRLALAKIQLDREGVIEELESSLVTQPDNEQYWQEFFSSNLWILQAVFSSSVFILEGETYLGGKLPTGRQGIGGVATDFLASDASTKSFSVVDIKTPAAKLVGPLYRGDAGSGLQNEVYSMHPALSGGVVQVRNQITVAVENFSETLGRGFADLNRVHPKGVLITGTLTNLNDRERDSFNHFRQGLFSLTVITYDEVLQRLRILFDPKWTKATGGVGSDDSDFTTSSSFEDSGDIPF